MSEPIRCFTCGYFLGLKITDYENKKKNICNNPDLNDDDKNEEIAKLRKSLNLKRPCCKALVMTFVNMVDIILPIPK